MSLTYTYFAYPIDFTCLPNFEKKNANLSCMDVWFLFGATTGVDYELFAPFWSNH